MQVLCHCTGVRTPAAVRGPLESTGRAHISTRELGQPGNGASTPALPCPALHKVEMRSNTSNAQKPRILIVDDEDDMQAVCSIITSNAGMEPVAFAEPMDALDYLNRGARVDVLLTDLNLPQMSGLDLAKLVGESQPSLPVVLMTGRHDFIDAAITLGAIPLLKPFSVDQLTVAIQDALERGAKGRMSGV